MEQLVVGLLLWLNVHGFPACTGEPDIHRASSNQTRGYVAWYQDEVIGLSDKFDHEGLLLEPSTQRAKLARSVLLHELVHYCQAQREGSDHHHSEHAWLQRENEAYALQTSYLREHGSFAVLAWRGNDRD